MSFAARLVRLLIVLAVSVAVLTASVIVIAPRVAELVGSHVSDHATISLEPLAERSYVYDRYGNVLGTLAGEQNRVKVKLSQISKPMMQTVIAIEDEHFYSHHGVNVRSIARAFSANLEQAASSRVARRSPSSSSRTPSSAPTAASPGRCARRSSPSSSRRR